MGAHCPTSFVAVSSQDWVRRVDMEAYPIAVCGGARGGVYVVNMEDKNVIAMADDVHSVQVEEKANQSKVHVATEMATMTRTQVLSQAGISMLAQANQMPQMALSLLR